ncbi:MAG: hypothetical protein M9911_14865 [Saprospiraceae bacterium]|nr:hypothetical protein [Saprospiraceae bacterium]
MINTKKQSIKLKDLVYAQEWLSVSYILIELYPEAKEDIDKYKAVYNELRTIEPSETSIILEMDRMWEEGEETNLASVYGYDPTLPDDSISKGIAIEFRPWQEWLIYELGIDAKEEWTDLEIICHALVEMTLEGWTQLEVRQSLEEIIGRVTEIKDEYFRDK